MSVIRRPVVVIGAGPVGLTTALVLAQAGVPVTVLESEEGLSTASKASTFHPSTLDLLDDLGVGRDLCAAGRRVDRIQWRNLAQQVVHQLDYTHLDGHTAHPYRLHAEQALLTPLLLEALAGHPHAEVCFATTAFDIRDHGDRVRIWAQQPSGRRAPLDAGYVVAADGSRSIVRTALGLPSAVREYPSYALRIITDTALDELLPGLSPLAYVRDARQSYSLLGMPDHWRLIFRIPGSTPRDQALDRETVGRLLARSLPDVHEWIRVRDAHTYRLAAFVLPGFQSGRVLFAGDAAHLTSTAGGMNMNCGLHDAVAWGRALAQVHHRTAGPAGLTDVAAARRRVVLEAAIPRSEARTAGIDGGEELNRAMNEIGRMTADPARATDYLLKASLLDCAPRPQPAR